MMTITEAKAEIHKSIRDGEHEHEANYPYENHLNDRQRALITAYRDEHGTCWLGAVNPSPERRAAPFWQWNGVDICNFDASFVTPCYDAILDALLRDRLNAPYTGTAEDYKRVTAIHDRIYAIGGDVLIWN